VYAEGSPQVDPEIFRLGIPIRQIGELEIKQEALPAEMEQSEAPGQSMGMA
jgi:hypothetical protein